MKISKDIPNGPLYRFFSKDEHVNNFMNGNIRLGWLKKYHLMEDDIREDTTEANAQYSCNDPEQYAIMLDKCTGKKKAFISKPGAKNISLGSLNEFYILCTSEVTDEDNLAQLRERFRDKDNSKPLPRYAIIHNVKMFTETVASAMELSEYSKYIRWLKWFKVEYSKGQERNSLKPPEHLEVYQKPAFIGKRDLTCEHEWRLALCIEHKDLITSLNNGNNIMFVTGEKRLLRIAEYADTSVEDLRKSPETLAMYEKETPLWIKCMTVNHPGGLQKCTQLYK
jgi:hypothetical protein